jgi:hypothetical protein
MSDMPSPQIAKNITKLGSSRGARGRWWLLTINNPEADFLHFFEAAQLQLRSIKYMVGQFEIGEECGTPHYQAVVWSSEAVRPTAIHKAFPGAHVLLANNPDRAIEYVTKEATRVEGPWEHGTRPVRRNNATDWQRVFDLARDNRILEVPPEIQIKHLSNLTKIRDMHLKPKDSPHGKVRGLWLFGPPDTGKSFFARHFLGVDPVYPKTQSKWWDGYQQEKVVVLDDMDSDCLAHYMKIWTDSHAFLAEAKGTTVVPNHHVFVVTSNDPIEEIFKGLKADFIQAIRRRFTVVQTHFLPFPDDDVKPDYNMAVYTLHSQFRSLDEKGNFKSKKENFTGPHEISKKLCEQFMLTYCPAVELPRGEQHAKVDFVANLLEESANEDAAVMIKQDILTKHEGFVEDVIHENLTVQDEDELEEIIDNGIENGVFLQTDEGHLLHRYARLPVGQPREYVTEEDRDDVLDMLGQFQNTEVIQELLQSNSVSGEESDNDDMGDNN